jgi:putative NIF3 family GTP cyclohydrolase 1 type 2
MSLLNEAIRSGADVYLTGDVKYHDAQEAIANGINVIDAGHYGTENIIVPIMKKYIEKLGNIEVIETSVDGNPFKMI